jgi:predicted Fe-Mo cluster-binding NifX family protein
MRLLIPTSDGITISPDFDMATSFRYLSVINGSVKDDELISINETSEKGPGIIDNIHFKAGASDMSCSIGKSEQQIVIARDISRNSEASLTSHNFKVFHSLETNIINAISRYIKDNAVNESEYCCCP